MTTELRAVVEREKSLNDLMELLKKALGEMMAAGANPAEILDKHITNLRENANSGKKNNTLSTEAIKSLHQVAEVLEKQKRLLIEAGVDQDGKAAIKLIKEDFDRQVAAMTKEAGKAGKKLTNLFIFSEEVFSEGQELLILVTDLTINYHTARFISRFGSKEYFAHNKELLFNERKKELILQLEKLSLEE